MSVDPSQTKTLREDYASRLRGIIGAVNAQARDDIVGRDIFGLTSPSSNARDDDRGSNPYPAGSMMLASRGEKVDRFGEWLRTQLQRIAAGVFTASNNPFIHAGYVRGMRNTDSALRQQGVDVPTSVEITAAVEFAEHQEQISGLTSRTQREWEGIIGAIVQSVTREVDDGLAAGDSRREIADRVSDRMQKVAKNRVTKLAHTEVVRAAASGNLQRAQQVGVEEVAGKAEYIAKDDSKTCPRCRSLDGNTYLIDEARELIPQHVFCRCSWWPVVEHPLQLTFATADQ